MKRNFYFNITLLIFAVIFSNSGAEPVDLTEPMKQSLVYLEISSTTYEQSQPWKQTQVSTISGYGCAVGPYEIITTAENVINATYIQARRYGENAYIPVTVTNVDYEYNLCLLEFNKESLDSPLIPLSFKESYPKGKSSTIYWLSSGNHLTTARATLDRAEMDRSTISFANTLTFFATNVSRPFSGGSACCYDKDPVGIVGWGSDSDAGIIPAEMINRFINNCKNENYSGFATAGFHVSSMLDPTVRKYLKVPDNIQHGVYISDVFSIGTGCQELKKGDVILSINGKQLNPYGRYEHPVYKRISFHHILLKTLDGEQIPFEILRAGQITTINVTARSVRSDNMLVPYYIYGKQPEYMVIGGYVFQNLTRDYLGIWGSNMSGKATPHLYHYQRDFAFKPSEDRKDIVILSYVLPAEINLGYQQLSQLVVDTVNGTKISSMKQFSETINNIAEDDMINMTFEMESPTLIIPKNKLQSENFQIARLYGIPKMMYIEE